MRPIFPSLRGRDVHSSRSARSLRHRGTLLSVFSSRFMILVACIAMAFVVLSISGQFLVQQALRSMSVPSNPHKSFHSVNLGAIIRSSAAASLSHFSAPASQRKLPPLDSNSKPAILTTGQLHTVVFGALGAVAVCSFQPSRFIPKRCSHSSVIGVANAGVRLVARVHEQIFLSTHVEFPDKASYHSACRDSLHEFAEWIETTQSTVPFETSHSMTRSNQFQLLRNITVRAAKAFSCSRQDGQLSESLDVIARGFEAAFLGTPEPVSSLCRCGRIAQIQDIVDDYSFQDDAIPTACADDLDLLGSSGNTANVTRINAFLAPFLLSQSLLRSRCILSVQPLRPVSALTDAVVVVFLNDSFVPMGPTGEGGFKLLRVPLPSLLVTELRTIACDATFGDSSTASACSRTRRYITNPTAVAPDMLRHRGVMIESSHSSPVQDNRRHTFSPYHAYYHCRSFSPFHTQYDAVGGAESRALSGGRFLLPSLDGRPITCAIASQYAAFTNLASIFPSRTGCQGFPDEDAIFQQKPRSMDGLTIVFDADETFMSARYAALSFRPRVAEMFRTLATLGTANVEVVIWTAGTLAYMAQTIGAHTLSVDPERIISAVIARDSPSFWYSDRSPFDNAPYAKNLHLLNRHMDRVVLIENSAHCGRTHRANTILVPHYEVADDFDRVLVRLTHVLMTLSRDSGPVSASIMALVTAGDLSLRCGMMPQGPVELGIDAVAGIGSFDV